jgi:hypothetical protein
VKNPFLLLVVLCLAAHAYAERYSTEDESRFHSEPYTKAEADMLPPGAYIERAKKALRIRFSDIRLAAYDTPYVSHRLYADAPAADRDVICVAFPYKELIKPPLATLKRLPAPDFMARAVLLVLIRKDLSKAYVNEVFYQIW